MALTRDLQQRYIWSAPLAPSAGLPPNPQRKNAGERNPSLCWTTIVLQAAGYNWSSAQIKLHNRTHSRTQRLKPRHITHARTHTHTRLAKIVHTTNTLLRIKCAFFIPPSFVFLNDWNYNMQMKQNLQCKKTLSKKVVFFLASFGAKQNQSYILSTRMMQTEHPERFGPARRLCSR